MNKRAAENISNLKKEIESRKNLFNWEGLSKEQCILTKNMFRFFEVAIHTLEISKFHSSEVAFFLLCSIIEGIAVQKYEGEHKTFVQWLSSRASDINVLIAMKNGEDFKSGLENLERVYKETYGIRKNFKKTIIKMYEGERVPYDIDVFEEKAKEDKNYTITKERKEVFLREFEPFLGKVYDNYRSRPLHTCKPVPYHSKILDSIGLSSHKIEVGKKKEWSIPATHFARIVLKVLDKHLDSLNRMI